MILYFNDDMPKVVQPEGFKGVTLFQYQLTLEQCHKLEIDKFIEKIFMIKLKYQIFMNQH